MIPNLDFIKTLVNGLLFKIQRLEEFVKSSINSFSVTSVNGQTGDVKLTASEVGAMPSTFTETDPTVPSWAKQASKPKYTAAEVGAAPTSGPVFTSSISMGRSSDSAVGISSVATGLNVVASGTASHAEGNETTASGTASHAEGWGTIAASDYQHVQGKYNAEDAENRYAHIVGNGSFLKPENIHTLDWHGFAWFAGKLFVGGMSQEDPNAAEVPVHVWEYTGELLTEILPETTKSLNYHEDNGYSSGTMRFTGALIPGETYRVSWNGTDYTCIARGNRSDNTAVVLGDSSTVTGVYPGGAGEPFYIEYSNGVNYLFVYTDGNVAESTIRIQHVQNAFKLKEECLPENAVKNGDTALILTSPGGKLFRITVDDDGTLQSAEVTA